MSIRDLLNSDIPKLEANDPIEKAIDLFRTETLHAVPVMDDGRLIGIITLVSVYQFLSRPGHYASCPIDWIMHKPPVTVSPDTPLPMVAKIMRDTHVFTIPVMENDRVAGVISVEQILDTVIEA